MFVSDLNSNLKHRQQIHETLFFSMLGRDFHLLSAELKKEREDNRDASTASSADNGSCDC